MSASPDIHSFSDGVVRFWIEQGSSIQLKAVTSHGDPVELNALEAERIANAFLVAGWKLKAL